jgi:hypothetical protein
MTNQAERPTQVATCGAPSLSSQTEDPGNAHPARRPGLRHAAKTRTDGR